MGREERRRAEQQERRRNRRPHTRDRPAPAAPSRGRPAAPAPPAATTPASLRTVPAGCDGFDAAEPQALGVTYEFDAAAEGEPYSVTIRFDGRRTDVAGEPGAQNRFSVAETIEGIPPGIGHITISKRIVGIAPGEWAVTVAPLPDATTPRPMPSQDSAIGATGFEPIIRARALGVRVAAWPTLVALGAGAALAAQTLLAGRLSLPVGAVLLVSLVACLVGIAGAKVYYLLEHPEQSRTWINITTGMCIQGFVLAAVVTLILGALIADIPVGDLLDVTAPGLLFGMAIGRVGCFLGGCCVGRPTASRWGLWSSNRRLGIRRIPTQLFESTMTLLVGVAAMLIVTTARPASAGVVFVGALAAHTLGRQLLFPLRELPRHTSRGRVLTLLFAGITLIAAIAVAVTPELA